MGTLRRCTAGLGAAAAGFSACNFFLLGVEMFIGHLVQLAVSVDDIIVGTLGRESEYSGYKINVLYYSIPSSAAAGWPGMRLSRSAADPR